MNTLSFLQVFSFPWSFYLLCFVLFAYIISSFFYPWFTSLFAKCNTQFWNLILNAGDNIKTYWTTTNSRFLVTDILLQSHTKILIFENLTCIKLTSVTCYSWRSTTFAIGWKPANNRGRLVIHPQSDPPFSAQGASYARSDAREPSTSAAPLSIWMWNIGRWLCSCYLIKN